MKSQDMDMETGLNINDYFSKYREIHKKLDEVSSHIIDYLKTNGYFHSGDIPYYESFCVDDNNLHVYSRYRNNDDWCISVPLEVLQTFEGIFDYLDDVISKRRTFEWNECENKEGVRKTYKHLKTLLKNRPEMEYTPKEIKESYKFLENQLEQLVWRYGETNIKKDTEK